MCIGLKGDDDEGVGGMQGSAYSKKERKTRLDQVERKETRNTYKGRKVKMKRGGGERKCQQKKEKNNRRL